MAKPTKDPPKIFLVVDNDSHDNAENLTIAEIASPTTPRLKLAYLSACYIVENTTIDLIYEFIRLPSCFQVIGFPKVVGSMWQADDKSACKIARLFYENMLSTGGG